MWSGPRRRSLHGMIVVQFFTRADIEKKLSPYRCQLIGVLPDGTDLWVTGWGFHFTLTPEATDVGLRYDVWQLQQVIATVIALTMPPGFNSAVESLDAARQARKAEKRV